LPQRTQRTQGKGNSIYRENYIHRCIVRFQLFVFDFELFLLCVLRGEEAARRHAAYVRTYDRDTCKVMHDYRYPLPAGLETLTKPGDMLKFEKLPGTIPS
jgi:hypothetical protein